MPKFALIKALSPAPPERPIEYPGVVDAEGKPIVLLIRPPMGEAETAALAFAMKHAAERGVENPRRGEPIFDIAERSALVAFSCVDPDSPEKARELVFESPASVLAEMPREVRDYFYECIEAWCSEVSPMRHQMTARELLDAAKEEAASVDDRFFISLAPALRWSFAHSLACLLVNSPAAMLLLSSLFEKIETEPLTPVPSTVQ